MGRIGKKTGEIIPTGDGLAGVHGVDEGAVEAAEVRPVYGIEETKQVLSVLCIIVNLAVTWRGITLDGIYKLLMQVLPGLVQAIEGIGDVPREIGDLEATEAYELIHLVRDKLDLPDDAMELIAEQAFRVTAELGILYKMVADHRAPTQQPQA